MKNEVIQKLSNIVTTGNENISYKKAIEKLNKNQLEKVGSQRSTGRPINIIEEEIDKIETEKKKLEEYKNKKYEVEEERQTIKINLEDTKTAIDLLRKQKVNLEKTKIELERVKIYKDMLIDDEHQKERITARIKELQEEREDNLKKNKIGYYISILAIIIITAISIIQKKYMILLANIVPIIVTILITIQNNKKSYKIKQEGKKIHQERIKLENELETIENEHNRKIKEIQQQENEILQNQKYQEEILKQEFNNKLDEQTIDNILSTTYEEIVEIIDEKERTQTQIQITAKTIEVDNENIVKELDNLVEMDEQLEKLYEKKDELLQLNNMYEMAKEEIEKSYQEMKENITPDFIEELKNIMIQVTNGKYANIYLDRENNLLIEIENGNYMPIEMLSIGTIDLIYLALRISAAREISKEKLPLILDESLAYYDDERLTRILKYLSQMKEYQILLFTCTGREEKILENNDIEYNKISL